ncbi:Optic atrophy 3-like domain-containing protein [Rozella allomycis CSF55]|uniref:Optic atrophy 3-like domain-containing protein n=1 Tax=Rozella allomycis (strain CSF55) TaxID=988480 RepID=A0A075APQ5_ROZAC|nr:Optic atrophy 3-like domain-containing protein [Rozella allomycis CSF55]|eukprot:EPZ32121.1 Optic atrophy 3-like domain-containing protein [Rozella allomycis CSF55]
MSIPLVKLGYLFLRTISKPIASFMKSEAKRRPAFRSACIQVAESYHQMEARMRSKLHDKAPERIRPLDEERAINVGANFIGEFIIFSVAGLVVVLESTRNKGKVRDRKEFVDESIETLESQMNRLQAEISELKDLIRREDDNTPSFDEMDLEEFSDSEIEEIVESDHEVHEANMDIENADEETKVYLPGDKLEEGEELTFDSSAYEMYHELTPEWPCLSFDIVSDSLGENRVLFPMSATIVAGSQASNACDNKLYVAKLSNLCKTKYDDDSDEESDDDEEENNGEPILSVRTASLNAGVNRVRAMPQSTNEHRIVSAWTDDGKVRLFNIAEAMESLENPTKDNMNKTPSNFGVIKGHKGEGFALDWSVRVPGRLLSGDVNGVICMTNVSPDQVANPDQFKGHGGSIEDLQWSPKENDVFASCSTDGTIKLWDVRSKNACILTAPVSSVDVNVISWNSKEDYLLASGFDDGKFSIFDLRHFSMNAFDPVASFSWHKSPITSIEWHPTDETVLAVSGADDQLTLWDFSLEEDIEVAHDSMKDIPPQLLFIHQGQDNIKELHWHRQLPNVIISTALNGFNIFKCSTNA